MTSKTFLILLSCCFLALAQSSSALSDKKKLAVVSHEYDSQESIRLYAGSKNIIRINNIPAQVNKIQVSRSNKNLNPMTRVLGKRNKDILLDGFNNSADFGVEISPYAEEAWFNVTTFKESEGAYQVLEHKQIQIKAIQCTTPQAVCGLPQINCDSYQACYSEKPKTYASICELNINQAQLIYEGQCI